MFPFLPIGATVSQAATTASAGGTASGWEGLDTVEITNATGAVAHVAIGAGAQTATTANYPVMPGVTVVVSKAPHATSYAVILTSGSGTVYLTPGKGA